jgi:hypothetical protein
MSQYVGNYKYRQSDPTRLYKKVVLKLHQLGITVMGVFIFSFEDDDEHVFRRTLQFAHESRIDAVQINILVPYPGTPLYQRLPQGGCLREDDWNWYRSWHVCFEPKQMSREVLQKQFLWVRKKFNSSPHIAERSFNFFVHSSPRIAALCLGVNLGSKRDLRHIPP